MYEEIDEKTRFILRFIGILILSVLIPFIGFLLMGMMDMTNLDRFLSPHLLLFGGIVLIVVISVVDYFALKKYRRKFIAFFIVLNFVMAVPVFQWINDEWAFGPTTPEKKALVDLLGVPESYSALTILPPPVPKRSNGSHGVRISSSAYVGCYIYTTYEVFLLTDPAEIRVPLTFLKDPQENAFKDYEYLLRKTKKKGYEEMNVSESDLNDIEEHLINPNKYAFLKRNNSLVFLEASKSHWRNCYELMVWKGDKEEIMRMLEEFYGDRP